MKTSARWRWCGYAAAAVMTVAAMRWVDDLAEGGGAVVGAPSAVPTAEAAVRRTPPPERVAVLELPRRVEAAAPQADPFATKEARPVPEDRPVSEPAARPPPLSPVT